MQLKGIVVRGRGWGRKLGYPTANLDASVPDGLLPGVYVGFVLFPHGRHPALIVVGAIPEVKTPSVEVHLLDWDGDLYGTELAVEIQKKITDIETLDSEEELKEKIAFDIAIARGYFSASNSKL